MRIKYGIAIFSVIFPFLGLARGENMVLFKNDNDDVAGGRSASLDKNASSSFSFYPAPPSTSIPRNERIPGNGSRDGRNLLSWIHSFTDVDTDPYLAKANAACLEGDLPECFKAKALSSLDDFFTKDSYLLNGNTKITRMPDEHVRNVLQEPYEFTTARSSDEPESEWDQFVKFLTRKVERFMKTTAVEVQFADEVTESGKYAPRFIDEISSELDTIQDKKAGSFSRKKLKKMMVPLLIILKLFKLKLLLFLPLILGLASFKKLLGLLAIVIPGIIGFYKLCKPDLHHNYGNFGHSNYYQRDKPPHQYVPNLGGRPDHHSYVNEYRGPESPDVIQYLQDAYYAKNSAPEKHSGGSGSISFRDETSHSPYGGYQQRERR